MQNQNMQGLVTIWLQKVMRIDTRPANESDAKQKPNISINRINCILHKLHKLMYHKNYVNFINYKYCIKYVHDKNYIVLL